MIEQRADTLRDVRDRHAPLEVEMIDSLRKWAQNNGDVARELGPSGFAEWVKSVWEMCDEAEIAVLWGDAVTADDVRMDAMRDLETAKELRAAGHADRSTALEVQARAVLALRNEDDAQRGEDVLTRTTKWHPRDVWNLRAAVAAHRGQEFGDVAPPHVMEVE